MFKHILATASVLTIMATGSAHATDEGMNKTKAEVKAEAATTGNIGHDAEKAWKNIKEDSKEAYEDIKAMFVDADASTEIKPMVIDSRHTATGMIGKGVYNSTNERVGTVKDIIIDADGHAQMLVVADYEVPGFDGKLVAFDYDIISAQNKDGDVMAPISEENIDKAAEFSYDLDDASNSKVRVIPTNGYAVSKLLEGHLVDPEGKNVADIENIVLKNGQASQLIVGFDKLLGMGGKEAVLNYDKASIVHHDDDLNFQLSALHTAQFDAYKETLSN